MYSLSTGTVLQFLPNIATRKLPKTRMSSSWRDFRFRLFLQVDGFRALMVILCYISMCSDLAKRRAALVTTLEVQSRQRHYDCWYEEIRRLRR